MDSFIFNYAQQPAIISFDLKSGVHFNRGIKKLFYAAYEVERQMVKELRALSKSLGLRGYSRLRKADLVKFIKDHLNSRPRPLPRPQDIVRVRPPRPARPPPQLVRFRPDRPRQPSSQEMDIFEQQEMHKSRPVVMSRLNDWYDWLINHVPSTIKDGASRVFKTFKDAIMGFYNRVTGNQAQWEKPLA